MDDSRRRHASSANVSTTSSRNAMEAQPDGGGIHVTASKTTKELVLRFADTGPGVAPEHRAELFEFGKTTKDRR